MTRDNRSGDDSGPAPPGEPDHAASAAAKQSNNASVDSHDHTLTGLRRRREASRRLIPLDCACRTADPWTCRCTRSSLSERMVDGGRAAALHLLDVGCAPIVELDVLRALHKRGGHDRQLAQRLWGLAG